MHAELDKIGGVEPAIAPSSKKGSSKMSMAQINFWLDAALFVSLIFIMWISAMLQMIFPPPTEAAGWTLWGLSFNDWQRVQFFSICAFALLAVEHLVLHWTWVCSVLTTHVLRIKKRPDEGEQAVYGVATFVLILIFVMGTLIAAMASATHVPTENFEGMSENVREKNPPSIR